MNAEQLLDAIGEVKDEYIRDARTKRKHRSVFKWASAAACLILAVGVGLFLSNIGGKAGSTGSGSDLNYMSYFGPVLPLTIRTDSEGITATRNINYDFSPYTTRQESYETDSGIRYYDRYETSAVITDSYTLCNTTDSVKTVTLLYPFVGNMSDCEYYPTISVEGNPVGTLMHPGPYSGHFRGVTGAENTESFNIAPPENFEDYKALLSSDSYRNSAFDPLPGLDQPVYVYRLHDYVYSQNAAASNPTLSMDFYIDYTNTTVFTYNMNGSARNYDTGYCSCRTGGIQYRPNLDPRWQHPEDAYVILLGTDLESYTVQGYLDGGCKSGEELNDLSCTVTRYETTFGRIVRQLLDSYLDDRLQDMDPTHQTFADESSSRELLMGLTAEFLYAYAPIGDDSKQRYDNGDLVMIFSEVTSLTRVIWLSFDVTLPALGSITVEASMLKNGNRDHYGPDKGREGYDLATTLGSCLEFTKQTASVSGFEEIQIVAQNFGFDPANRITNVVLDPAREYYWLEVQKRRTE